jgi:hypothetical protein
MPDVLQGGWGGDLVPICRVPLSTSHKEEQALINANNMKPVHIGNFLKGKSFFP